MSSISPMARSKNLLCAALISLGLLHPSAFAKATNTQPLKWKKIASLQYLRDNFDDADEVFLCCLTKQYCPADYSRETPVFKGCILNATVIESYKGELATGNKITFENNAESWPTNAESEGNLCFVLAHNPSKDMRTTCTVWCDAWEMELYGSDGKRMRAYLRGLGKGKARQHN